MPNKLIYPLMLAASLGLAACDDKADNPAEGARETPSLDQNTMNNDAAEQQRREEAEAAQRRADENQSSSPAAPISPPPATSPQQ